MDTPLPKLEFEVLLNDSFEAININTGLSPVNNKKVLSLINDFEDGNWRYKKFQRFIWDNIAETALSFRERNSLINHTLLSEAAKNLRLSDKDSDIGKGSELAEIILYGIMKNHYNALPVVPKIFYKQNDQDNAKGADSVHIVIEGEDDFSIWFGEAKFYNNIEDTRLNAIVDSVENSLQTRKLEKENSIITNVSDIDYLVKNENLRNKIKDALSPKESIDLIKTKLHIPILLLHECEITKTHNQLSDSYKEQIKEFHKNRALSYFAKQINKFGSTLFMYSEVKFHIILFPVPLKESIVNSFISNVEHYKQQ